MTTVLGAALIGSNADGGVTCELLPREEPRLLNLHEADQQIHLELDAEAVRRVAERFAASVARRPRLSDSIDARAATATAPERARAWCEAVLLEQVATLHHVPVTEVRARMGLR